jgi:ATP-dependent DNA helicase RecQ
MQAEAVIQQYFGYTSFRAGQQEVVEAACQGKDVLAILSTGAGKSVCYQVPALCNEGTCIVVSPLIALMRDQVFGLLRRKIQAVALVGGMSNYELDRCLQQMVEGKYKFVFVSPERAKSELFRSYLEDTKVNFIAVDEAHCISQWGYDFRPPYLNIAELREFCPQASIIALTASATPLVQSDILDKLAIAKATIVKGSVQRSNIAITCSLVQSKYDALLRTLSKVQGSTIIYCRNRGTCVKVAEFLRTHNYEANFYHAGLGAAQRSALQDEWISGDLPIICCTNAFGMGIDKPDVRLIIHYDAPDSLEAYYQEIGRAGRDGNSAFAVLLYQGTDFGDVEQQVARRYPPIQFVRNCYQKVLDYLRIAYNEGEGESKDFDIVHCAKAIDVDIITLTNTLKFLEQQQLLQLSDSVYTPSKVQCLASRDQLDFTEQYAPQRDLVMKAILRLYAGVFYDAVNVNEQKIAQFADLDPTTTRELLHELHEQELIVYHEAKDKPQLHMTRERLYDYDLHLDESLLKFLRDTYQQRLEAAYAFYLNTSTCRTIKLAHYFGEEILQACGICNNCLRNKNEQTKPENFNNLHLAIEQQLSEGNMSMRQLQDALAAYSTEHVTQAVYALLEQDVLQFNKNGNLALINS